MFIIIIIRMLQGRGDVRTHGWSAAVGGCGRYLSLSLSLPLSLYIYRSTERERDYTYIYIYTHTSVL